MIDKIRFVNGGAYMDFKTATDQLCEGISHEELASALGVSVATIRQARLEPTAKAHRSPPPDWAEGVKAVAASKLERLQRLLSELEGKTKTVPEGSRARFRRSNTEDGSLKPGARPRARG